MKLPVCARPGIEENRDDGEIDPGPSRFGPVGPGRDLRRSVDPSGREMPPSAVVRHVEIGIAPSGDVGDAADRLLQPRHDDPKLAGLATFGSGKYDAAAISDGRRGQQFRGFVSRREHDP